MELHQNGSGFTIWNLEDRVASHQGPDLRHNLIGRSVVDHFFYHFAAKKPWDCTCHSQKNMAHFDHVIFGDFWSGLFATPAAANGQWSKAHFFQHRFLRDWVAPLHCLRTSTQHTRHLGCCGMITTRRSIPMNWWSLVCPWETRRPYMLKSMPSCIDPTCESGVCLMEPRFIPECRYRG